MLQHSPNRPKLSHIFQFRVGLTTVAQLASGVHECALEHPGPSTRDIRIMWLYLNVQALLWNHGQKTTEKKDDCLKFEMDSEPCSRL